MLIWPISELNIQGRAEPIFDRNVAMDFNAAKPVSQVPILPKLQAVLGALNGSGNLAEAATPRARCLLAQVVTLVTSSRTDSPIQGDSTIIPAKPAFLK